MALKKSTLLMSAIGVTAVIGLGIIAFRTEPVPVDLVAVTRGPLQITVNADGKTRIKDRYEIFAPIAGTARRSPVAVGDELIKGQTVVAVVEPVAPGLLDSRSRLQAEAAIQEARAALQVAETRQHQANEELAFAQSQLERTKRLAERGVVSMTQLESDGQRKDIAEASRDTAVASRAMASSALARAEALLVEPADAYRQMAESCCVEIRAPVSGVVLAVDTISEHTVGPGQRLLSIGQTDQLEIVADLLSGDAVRLTVGAEAIVERWGGPEPLLARIRSIEPSARTEVSALGINEQRVYATLDLLSPAHERVGLGDGFAVFLRIIEWSGDDLLLVPLSAVFREGENWGVFAVDGSVAHKTTIKLGKRNGSFAQVMDGLVDGQNVITHPGDAIADGVKIVDRSAL
jgi:HlyD family secretion protein